MKERILSININSHRGTELKVRSIGEWEVSLSGSFIGTYDSFLDVWGRGLPIMVNTGDVVFTTELDFLSTEVKNYIESFNGRSEHNQVTYKVDATGMFVFTGICLEDDIFEEDISDIFSSSDVLFDTSELNPPKAEVKKYLDEWHDFHPFDKITYSYNNEDGEFYFSGVCTKLEYFKEGLVKLHIFFNTNSLDNSPEEASLRYEDWCQRNGLFPNITEDQVTRLDQWWKGDNINSPLRVNLNTVGIHSIVISGNCPKVYVLKYIIWYYGYTGVEVKHVIDVQKEEDAALIQSFNEFLRQYAPRIDVHSILANLRQFLCCRFYFKYPSTIGSLPGVEIYTKDSDTKHKIEVILRDVGFFGAGFDIPYRFCDET